MKYLVLFTCFIVLVACSEETKNSEPQNEEINTSAEIEKIEAKIKEFSKHVVAGDYQAIGNMYTTDGKIFPGGSGIMEGRDQIIYYWSYPSSSTVSYHKVTPKEIKIWGDEAYDYGYYEGRSKDSLGNESPWKGKYVIIWKKEDQDWKVHLDIWNRIND